MGLAGSESHVHAPLQSLGGCLSNPWLAGVPACPLPSWLLPGVFLGSDFVTVTKSDEYSWPVLKPDIFAAMMDHFSSGEPLFTDKELLEASDTAIRDDDDEVRPGQGCTAPHTGIWDVAAGPSSLWLLCYQHSS